MCRNDFNTSCPGLIQIRFAKSNSKNYGKAISIANQFNNYRPISENNDLNTIKIEKEELQEKNTFLQELWDIICNWKSTELYINNKKSSYYILQQVFKILNCEKQYNTSIIPQNHCKTGNKLGWGCQHLTMIERYVSDHTYEYYYNRKTYWYEFGYFNSEDAWEIDKKTLLESLKKEIEINHLDVCSIFNIEAVKKSIDRLPDSIDIKNSDKWDYKYEEYENDSLIEQNPIGIVPKKSRDESNKGINIFTSVMRSNNNDNSTSKKNKFIPNTTFDDIGGIDDIIQTIREVIELPIINPDLFKYLGIEPHKGILLYGPPGCGKTMIAKAIANEIKAHFIAVNGPEILNKYYGQSEENLRNIFKEAREFQPSIIFFDEIDSIAQNRSGQENLRFNSQIVNQLLTLMDGIEDYGNVCVIASTNRPELIDEALLRPGRFDYSIEIKKPTKEGCCKIFTISTRNMPVVKSLNKRLFSEKLFGLSGAEINFVAREGAYNCLRRSINLEKILKEKDEAKLNYDDFIITENDFYLAFKKIKNGI